MGHLGGLVSVHEGGTVSGNQLKSFAMPLVASGQDGNVAESPVVALQELPQNHFRMRSLSGAANCDVSNTDGGNIGLADLLDLFVVSEVAQGQDEPVQHYIESTLRTEISSWLMGLSVLMAREMGTYTISSFLIPIMILRWPSCRASMAA